MQYFVGVFRFPEFFLVLLENYAIIMKKSKEDYNYVFLH